MKMLFIELLYQNFIEKDARHRILDDSFDYDRFLERPEVKASFEIDCQVYNLSNLIDHSRINNFFQDFQVKFNEANHRVINYASQPWIKREKQRNPNLEGVYLCSKCRLVCRTHEKLQEHEAADHSDPRLGQNDPSSASQCRTS